MNEYTSVFVILRNGGRIDECDSYSAHGNMGGLEDAIGYGGLLDARKFLTKEAAQTFIDHELPEWGRSLHHPAEVFPWELIFVQPSLSWYLHHPELDIPADLLEPSKGRLLIWRR